MSSIAIIGVISVIAFIVIITMTIISIKESKKEYLNSLQCTDFDIQMILNYMFYNLKDEFNDISAVYCENSYYGTFYINKKEVFTDEWFKGHKMFIDNLNYKMQKLHKIKNININFYYYEHIDSLKDKYKYFITR